MSKYKQGYQTDKGQELAQQAINGQITLTPTRAVLSSDDYSNADDDTIEALTSLSSFTEIKIDIGAIQDASNVNIPIDFLNDKQTSDNYIKTVGIYFSDGTNEYLYSVLVNEAPTIFPAYNGSVAEHEKFIWGIFVGRASQVNITMTNMENVTQDMLSTAVMSANTNAKSLADSAYSAAAADISSAVNSNSGIAQSFSAVEASVSTNSNAIVTLQSSVAANSASISNAESHFSSTTSSAYQSAVATAKNYTDQTVIPFTTRSSAISYALTATRPGLCVYPESQAYGKVVDVSGIYTYGDNPAPNIEIPLNNLNSSFSITNGYLDYNPNTFVGTFHGTIAVNANITPGENIFNFDVTKIYRNVVESQNMGSQVLSGAVDPALTVVTESSTYSGYVSNIYLDGCTITLGYDSALVPGTDINKSVWGASWNGSSSSQLTRTDAAVGMQSGINGNQNDFDNTPIWGQMSRVTDSQGNVFVRIPKFYIKKTSNNGGYTWQASLVQQDSSWYLPKCFYNFGSSSELNYVDVGAYPGSVSGSNLQSKSGTTPTVNQTIDVFRSQARTNGTGYQQLDIHVWDMLQVLFIIEFATLNSKSVMYGNAENATSGTTDGLVGSSKGNNDHMSYRGIEDMYCNVWQFVDGIGINSESIFVCDDANSYTNSQFAYPYNQVGYQLNGSGNWTTQFGYDSNHPEVTLGTQTSSTEGAIDGYTWSDNGTNYTMVVGGYGSYSYYGLFYSDLFCPFSYSSGVVGARLIRKALS